MRLLSVFDAYLLLVWAPMGFGVLDVVLVAATAALDSSAVPEVLQGETITAVAQLSGRIWTG
jgi:hypothetical protein